MERDGQRRAFWLLADDRLALGSDELNERRMRAHVKHTLLFHPRIVISDSYVIKSYNLRRLIKFDEQMQEIIKLEMIVLACRDSHEGRMSLRAVRDRTPPGEGPREFSDEEYRSDEELDFLESWALKQRYSLPDISRHYTRSTRELFGSERALEVLNYDETALQILNEVIEERCEQGEGSLRLAQFFYGHAEGIPRLFSKRSGLDWAPFKAPVEELAWTHYLTGLPTLLKTDAVYAREHARAFELAWKRPRVVQGEQPVRFQSRLGLDAFVAGLALLEVEDIVRLRGTDEGRSYERLISERSRELKLIKEIMLAYQRRIEDQIILRHDQLRLGSSEGAQWLLRLGFSEQDSSKGGVRAFLNANFKPSGGGGFGIMTRSPVDAIVRRLEARGRAKVRSAQPYQQAREELLSTWSLDSEQLRSDLRINERLEALYTD